MQSPNEAVNMDGKLFYLKPRSTAWEALTEDDLKEYLSDDQALDEQEIAARVRDNQQYMNDFLLRALQIPNLSFFAGSGTSLGVVNGPSMGDLWQKAVKSDHRSTEVQEKVRYQESNPNIEHFLSQCDAYLAFNDDPEVDAFMLDVKSVILHECSSFIGNGGSDISAYQSLLQKLARRRVRDPRLKVFTTNYDMCFETAAANLGMMVIDGFSYSRYRRFDPKFFDYDVVRRELESHEFVEGVIKLYKIHGSVSWGRNGKDILELSDPDPKDAVLIYPAKGKYQQAFLQPHLELLSRFLEMLRVPNTCIMISGFGFNDDHLSEPILSAIESNPSLKLIISDYRAHSNIESSGKGSSLYWKRLYELSNQGYDIHFINGDFTKFVGLIPNLRAITPADQLVKAIKGVRGGNGF